MLLKRAINTLRFPAVLVQQLLLPIAGVVLAMVLAVSISVSSSDPKRALTIDNSAASTAELTLFYAQFENSSGLDLSVSGYLEVLLL